MNNDASPSSFYDARTGSPDEPVSNNNTPSAVNAGVTTPVSAIGQRRLFAGHDDKSNNNNASAHLVSTSHQNRSFQLDMLLVHAEEEEDGEGDSNCSADEFEGLNSSVNICVADRNKVLYGAEDTTDIDVLLDEHDDNIIIDGHAPDNSLLIEDLGEDVSFAKPPADWAPKAPKTEVGEPDFYNVDNPGGWDAYTFKPKFSLKTSKDIKKGQYTHHALPTGARPVPQDAEGKRGMAGWEFHYDHWENPDGAKFRSGATRHNPFPANRKGNLDYDLLKKMGLTKERLVSHDALFFWQLLFPICDPEKSGIADDPRIPYYSSVEKWSTLYAASLGILSGSYGHNVKPFSSLELLHFDMVVIRDGVLGGQRGAIYRRWKKDCSAYDTYTVDSITYSRFLEVKRCYKLCDNSKSPKKGQPGYDPAYKYDHIYKCLIGNVNSMTELADLDLCGDETTCGHGGFGEAGTGVLARRMGKPGITFGMQTVIVSDVHRNRPRAYTHRHKCWEKPPGWGKEGPCKVWRLIENLEPMVLGKPHKHGTCQIFSECPHSTWDNYFSGDDVMDYLGEKGFSATMTCQRNRLPKGVADCFLHKEKTTPGDKFARVARFNKPITLVKTNTKKAQLPVIQAAGGGAANVQPTDITWTRVHVTFQSTSSTNISTVNALNANQLFVREKERGRGNSKRKWAIEMNQARQLYLASYGRIDTIDSLIKHCNLYYRSWKYWHASKLHVQALGLVVAYDMFCEIVQEGYAHFDFETKEAAQRCCMLSFYAFHDHLSKQGLAYKPEKKAYPGDWAMRAVTSKKRKHSEISGRKKRKKGRPPNNVSPEGGDDDDIRIGGRVTLKELKEKKTGKERLCGDLEKYLLHKESIETIGHELLCKWCGDYCYTKCGVCGLAAHDDPKRGKFIGRQCFTKLHSEACFGLAITDCALVDKEKEDWTEPTPQEKEANSKHIQEIQRKVPYGLRRRAQNVVTL